MLPNHKKAILIGETKLCIQCAEYLIDNKWKILTVVSDDKVVIDWSKNHSLPVLPVSQLSSIKENSFYLFSIINPYLIPESFLSQESVLFALNYHDSLLPRYAGINSTTWAIINNEEMHGVTLHQIGVKTDDGDIAAQSTIAIAKDETAISLNLKCSENLLSLFQEVITKIEQETLSLAKQNLANRTYYGAKAIPINYAIVNGIENFELLYRLVRALTFGDGYDNQVASVKVFLADRFYIAESFNADLPENNYAPSSETIVFHAARDIYGNKTHRKITHQELSIAYTLTSDDLQYLSNIKALERKHKKQILHILDTHDASIKILDHISIESESDSKDYTQEIAISDQIQVPTILALIYFVLARFFHNSFIISLYKADATIPPHLRYLVENRNFLCITKKLLNYAFSNLEKYLTEEQENNCVLVKDFGYRYGLELLTDIAIVVGKVELIDKHKIAIRIEDNKLVITGNIAYQLQINSIAEVISTMVAKNIQNEVIGKDLRKINILSEARYQQIVYEWNKTDKPYPKDKTIHQLFEEQVEKTPNNIALVYENVSLTYKELNQKANQLAHYLIKNFSIKPDDLVALCLDRSEHVIIAMLAVLKAGGAYVPIDPSYPEERIKFILEDTKVKALIKNRNTGYKTRDVEEIEIDAREFQQILSKENLLNLETKVLPANLAYVIYTSGTIGKPKGVMIEHRCVANFAINNKYIEINQFSNVLGCSNHVFDGSVFDIFSSLLNGAKIILLSKTDILSTERVAKIISQYTVNTVFITTALFNEYVALKKQNPFTLVDKVLFGGEAVNIEAVHNFIKYRKNSLHHVYGPTETTVFATCYKCHNEYKNIIPIGSRLEDKTCYVVDNNMEILTIGAIGELYIGGASLARGYLNQLQLTAEKFIPNPFQTLEEKLKGINGRLYKTGDLVRMLPDRNLEYIGRSDGQVKIRGFRIELGEIENKLLNYPQINQVVVIARGKENRKDLVAYYVTENKLDQSKLRDYLLSQLPAYMVPSAFVPLQKLPLTENGKLDKKSLPEPIFINQLEYMAPRNELEKMICEIYAQVLSLPIQQVGVKGDFFRMGGDSISSIQIVSRIRQQLGLTIAIQDVFNQRTIEQLAANVLISQSTQKEKISIDKIVNKGLSNETQENIETENVYLANNLQQGLIYHAIRQGETDDAYLSQFIWQYKTPIDEKKFKQAWQLTQKKYPSLRLRFAWDPELIQIIDTSQALDFRYIDLTNSPKKSAFEYQSQIANIIKKDRQEHYVLQKGNLIRVYLAKLAANDYLCMYSIHHIILDGWSHPLLLNSVHEIYSQLLENKQPQITEDVTYKKAQKYLQEHKNEHQEYWSDYIQQVEGRVDLRALLKPQVGNTEIKNHAKIEQEQEQLRKITGEKFAELKIFCQANAITINAVVQYVWHKILHIYGANDITVVGTVVSGRNIPIDNIENTVGLFINTLPLIFLHDNNLNLIEQIKSIQNSINTANSKSNVNLANLQSDGERLFDSLVVYENFPYIECTTNIKRENVQEIFKVDYPLAIIVYEKEQVLLITLKYAGELFSEETIAKLLDKLLFFVAQILENPYKKNLNYLTQEEYQQVVIDYNKTEKEYPNNKTIHQLFEEQALKAPNNIAVIYEDKKLTYQELNTKANQLANYILKNNDIKPDDLIALILDRSEYMIISILATLKTGAAYVPIDPSSPDERIKYILEDTKAKIVIKVGNTPYKAESSEAIEMDARELQQILSKEDASDPKTNVSSTNLVYVLYTSGTTGKPKGVMLEHKGVVNYIEYLIEANILNPQTSGSQYANFSFDATIIEIFPIILSGGTLHIIRDLDKLDPIKVNNFFVENSITYAFLPTTFAEIFFELKNSTLKKLIVGGDKLQKFTPQCYQVINAYGPTETTVQSNYFIVKKQYQNIPIGKPIPNVTNYILDKNLNVLPTGTIGELYIGGCGLARGYLNQPQLTAEKFISNPFQTEKERSKNLNNKLYKTGDFMRMLPDGNIEYIERKDFQVKIRGYRVELGEIESKLINYSGITQATVVLNEESNNKYLVAYYVADKKLDEQKLKDSLSKQLPHYMIPGAFVYLKKLPLTRNGKLDKKALPKPEFVDKINYSAPKNEREKLVCDAFAKILSLQKVGINDDFFSLGGNSIQAIRLTSVLQANFDINIADIFDLRTPRNLAKSSIFGKNFLLHKLELIKIAYKNKEKTSTELIDIKLQKKLDAYTKTIEHLQVNRAFKKPIHNVLLTGSTGYLGCNILNQLLKRTHYKIYLLIRAGTQTEATERINKKYQFYFDKPLNDVMDVRLFIIKADIEKNYLGLSQPEYEDLATKIDSTIHAAALVKHYGEHDKFYSANVDATVNLLEFAKLTGLKDFHYISTTGVLHFASAANNKQYLCTEDDLPNNPEVLNNVYIQTKLYGEHQTTKYRSYGINGTIYRVGNLAFISENYRTQENLDDNAFYNWLKCLFTIKCSTKVINKVEISQVDLTAQAIVKIFDKKFLHNQIYHVFNPYLFDLTDHFKNNNVKIFPIETFIDCIEQHMKDGGNYDLLVRFLLRQGWLDWWEEQNATPIKILQNRTQAILKKLDFNWLPMTDKIVCNYFNALKLGKGKDMQNKPKILSDLEKFALLIPAPVSWLDINGVVLGGNDLTFQGVGTISARKWIIGKTPYAFHPKDVADIMMENIKRVIQEKKLLEFEESIVDIKTGKIRWWLTTRAPLFDDDGMQIIGVICTSVEITERKENEYLRLENLRIESELQKTKLLAQEQEKFRTIAGKVAHDIRSPLTSLSMTVKACAKDLPEAVRITLREVAISIGDIANNLLSEYKNENEENHKAKEREPVIVSLVLSQLLADKKCQFKNLPVHFNYDFCPSCNFVFIKVEPTDFKRMLSNLINNAVEAFEGNAGNIDLMLQTEGSYVKIIIQDNGKGIPEEVLNKIVHGVSITSGKKGGSGIGLMQVRDALQSNAGEIAIDSKSGKGTKITLTFPITTPAAWFADEIKLNKDDTVVVLDDDPSIHSAWATHFEVHAPDINLQHFTLGQEAIDFINATAAKDKIFLLTDYELLQQELHGVDVIEKTGIQRSILVTSHYANDIVRDLALKAGIKILPKQIASDIPIIITENQSVAADLKKIDIVIIEDSETLANAIVLLLSYKGKAVDKYDNPKRFLENIAQYSKYTKICMDNDFGSKCISGIELAKQLHEAGFTKLCLFSGKDFDKGEVPDYLTVIKKGDQDYLDLLLRE